MGIGQTDFQGPGGARGGMGTGPIRIDVPTITPNWSEDSPALPQGMTPVAEGELIQWVQKTCWEDWMDPFRAWHRQIEENIRMLSGRQYDAFIPTLSDFVDLSSWFVDADEAWRQFPVFNWVANYFKLTQSKLTENLPAIGFTPATADFNDATLAQVMEPYFKFQWKQMDMAEQMFELYGWVIAATRAITKLRWDPDRGPAQEFRGPAIIDLVVNGLLERRNLSDAPYVRQNEGFVPAILQAENGDVSIDEFNRIQFGQAESSRLGDLAFDVLPPSSVVWPHGPEPFHMKPWYTHEYLLPVEDAARRFEVELEPEEISADDDLNLKLLYGENYGMPNNWAQGFSLGRVDSIVLKGYVRVKEHWRRPIPNHPILSKGRLLVVTKDRTIYDDINPFWVDGMQETGIMPFDAFDQVPVPFRNEGMSDLEIINPIQRAFNRRMAGAMDSVDHNEQPTTIWNEHVIEEEDLGNVNRPGNQIRGNLLPQLGPPFVRFDAADLPRGSIDLSNLLLDWMQVFGAQGEGAAGQAVTEDASGELQREVRFDSDRVWGATLRKHSYVWSRIALKIQGITAACMEDERLIVLAGADQMIQYVNISRELLTTGRVNTEPQPESQILESRQEKQNRVLSLMGVELIDRTEAREILNYPDVNRATRPGGIAFSLANQENIELLLGGQPQVFPTDDHAAHLVVHLRQMQTVQFRQAEENIQFGYFQHVQLHELIAAQEVARKAVLAAQVSQSVELPTPGAAGSPAGPEVAPGSPVAAPPGAVETASLGSAPSGAELEAGEASPAIRVVS